MRRTAAALIFASCGVLLLLTWHGYEGRPLWLWSTRPNFNPFRLNNLDFALKVAGFAFIGAALLVWPKKSGDL